MNKKILVQQTLHGYLNGHHLLASSRTLSDYSQKIMSVLSDLSGPEIYKGFSEYLTGYPLAEDNYYAISKTWYASEMKRPGCVWTHTLLINMKDLCDIKKCSNLIKLFVRPSSNNDRMLYCKPIELAIDMINEDDDITNDVSPHKLKELIYLIYNFENPIIIPSRSSEEYMNETLILWENQNPDIRKKFTFCTGALAARKINRENFDLQVVPINLSRSIVRTIGTARTLDDFDNEHLSYNWVNVLYEGMNKGFDSNFYDFFKAFAKGSANRIDISKIGQLFDKTDFNKGIVGIDQYFYALDKIWLKSDSIKMKNLCISQLFDNIPNRWFKYKDTLGLLQDLSIIDNLDGIEFNSPELRNMISLAFINYRSRAKETFMFLIKNDVNGFGEYLIQTFAELMQASMLPEITDMDLGSCHILITLNPELSLCTEIWNQSKDFQSEILNCINPDFLDDTVTFNILEKVFLSSNESIGNQIYKKFGKKAINVLFNLSLKLNDINNKKVVRWLDICKNEPKECIEWILKGGHLASLDMIIYILLTLDPYKREVFEIDTFKWIELYRRIQAETSSLYPPIILAELFLPLILLKNDIFPNDIVEFSYLNIHEQLAKQEFNFEKWEKLEKLLPEVAWFNSWDKCKRLRKAMKQKGYILE